MEQKEEKVGLTVKKADDFNEWYTQIVLKADLMDYSLVSDALFSSLILMKYGKTYRKNLTEK